MKHRDTPLRLGDERSTSSVVMQSNQSKQESSKKKIEFSQNDLEKTLFNMVSFEFQLKTLEKK